MADSCLGYFLLNLAKLSEDHKKLVRATITKLDLDEVKTKLKNTRSKQVKLQEKRKVRETDEEEKETDRKQEPQAKVVKESKTPEKLRKPSGNSGPAESKGRSSEQEVRGRTMERGREKGPNSRRHRKGQKTSGLQSKERKRTESPVSTRRPAGLFSEVKDNITGVEESDTDDDSENDTEDEESEEDSLGFEESGEGSLSSDDEEVVEGDCNDEEDGRVGGGGSSEAPGGPNL